MLEPRVDFKQQMAEARRAQILLGAVQVFSRRGFHKATTKEIAETAEVAEGTIYNYFETKRDLLLALMEQLGTQVGATFHDHPIGEPQVYLADFLHHLYNLLQARGHIAVPVLAEVFADEELRPHLYQQLIRPVAGQLTAYLAGQLQAPGSALREPALAANAIIGALLLNFIFQATGLDTTYQDISEEVMIEQLVSLFLDGLQVDNRLLWLAS